MQTMTHTPGPWSLSDDYNEATHEYIRAILGADGTIVVDAVNPQDASLIAAAPDLLARVEAWGHDMGCGSRRPEESLSDACTCGYDALIAKARGEA
jgi:hypothetical protein